VRIDLIAKRRYAPREVGVGQFSRVEQVQNPQRAIVGNDRDAMIDNAGIRLAMPKKSPLKVYRGSSLTPQRFTRPSEYNTLDAVRAGGKSMSQRRVLGRTRGAPEV
jgi:hypothetical protein